jgi:hypothetical protein
MHSVPPQSTYPQTSYMQQTPYGMIPDGWTIDEPVKRKEKPEPPKRLQPVIKMPFKDFSQS